MKQVPSGDDNVARWNGLLGEYPHARWSYAAPFYYGALREEDQVMRAMDLGRLIDMLLAGEPGQDA